MTKSDITINQAHTAFETLEDVVSEDFAGHLETVGIFMDTIIRRNEVLAGIIGDFSSRLEEAKNAFASVGYDKAVDNLISDDVDRAVAKMNSPYRKDKDLDSDPSL